MLATMVAGKTLVAGFRMFNGGGLTFDGSKRLKRASCGDKMVEEGICGEQMVKEGRKKGKWGLQYTDSKEGRKKGKWASNIRIPNARRKCWRTPIVEKWILKDFKYLPKVFKYIPILILENWIPKILKGQGCTSQKWWRTRIREKWIPTDFKYCPKVFKYIPKARRRTSQKLIPKVFEYIPKVRRKRWRFPILEKGIPKDFE
jgi:hypothetical protein